MLIRYGYDITLTCTQPTPMISLLAVHDERRQDVHAPEQIVTTPPVGIRTYRDLYGNTCRRFVAPAGDLSLWGDGTVADDGQPDPVDWNAAEAPVAELPDDSLVYLLGSRYCETDRLSQTAWDMFGTVAPGWGRVQAICNFVNGHIAFDYLSARATRTAHEAFHERVGVCRDYAHLAIALCRCMNIPARYVNGYLGDIGVPILDPMDFSAWIEVYIGGRWMTFDPRNNMPRIGRIVVARGRDAADVPLINSFGAHTLKAFRVWTYDVTSLASTTPAGSG
ncbi:transglutaminase-like putative cysteine protease [Rhodobium orientis]|uniref:Transglutaminase n=1 Tax=Rhodobium orientis TaxID=34017 RepID=A0A327JRL0_9HYPH|nr:transglutaminase family protein [Rhodobium orientis]MBB4302877.1 transglutaminase-like putative cysteine protease [Rhodobium orientis]MBK5949438.1 transglutaminase [Rhodobium orientis]RAI26008.1 transglutaminase [Rhodobium orientis]